MVIGCDRILTIFESCEGRKLPVYNAGLLLSGLMEITGKIIAYGILEAENGISYLAPCVFHYIITDNISVTIAMVSIEDVFDHTIEEYVDRVSVGISSIVYRHNEVYYMRKF